MVANTQDPGVSGAEIQDQAAPCELISSSEPRQTLMQVHDEAKGLASSMFEAFLMCLHVLERLAAIIRQVESSKPHTSLQAISRFSMILRTYLEFLKKFSNQKAAFRLVYNRTVVNQNLKFHDDLDNLLRGLNFPEDNWRQRWGGYRDAQQAAFEAMSENRMALMRDLRDAQGQTEALSLLMFEFNKVNSKYTPKELKVLNNAFSIVSQFSNNKTPTIATWFLPPYEFEYEESPFAWGAFGTVHLGKHGGSDVVIKRARISTEADRALFVKEANTWFNANQIPNVVRLFGAYHVGTTPYFVCEYASNGTLSDHLFKEENYLKTWKLLHEAALGLRGLHRLKIVHNDLKCNNILVASDGIAKITDFGLSSQLSVQQSQSVSKAVGAFSWKAPEVLAGSAHPSFASDVYSFAMCIYEAVSHTVPWSGTMKTIIQKNVEKGILPKRPEGFSDDQWTLLVDMCKPNPMERLSMDAVVKQLRKFAEDEFNSVHTPPNSANPSIIILSLDNGIAGESSSALGPASMDSTPAYEGSGTENSSPASSSARSSECKLPTPCPSSPEIDSEADIAIAEQPTGSSAAADPPLTMRLPADDPTPSTQDDDSSAAPLEDSAFGTSASPALPTISELCDDAVAIVNAPSRAADDAAITPSPPPQSGGVIDSLSIAHSRTKFENGKKFILYEVAIKLRSGGYPISVWKRFSDFRHLHQHFSRNHVAHMVGFPRFPSRKPFSRTTSARVIQQRKDGINEFLNAIMSNSQLQLGIDVGPHDTVYKANGSSTAIL